MIRASVFAQAGLYHYDFIAEWTETALQCFKNVAEASSYSDIAIPYKDKYLGENNGFFHEKYNKGRYVGWSAYSGLTLEDNWTKDNRRVYDFTFRCYLINAIAK